jgi:hypothetical protein
MEKDVICTIGGVDFIFTAALIIIIAFAAELIA